MRKGYALRISVAVRHMPQRTYPGKTDEFIYPVPSKQRTIYGQGGQSVARVSTYLNFMGNADEAFEFYKTVFGTEYLVPVQHMSDVPADPNGPTLSEAEKRMVLHAELPILGGHLIMASDMLESMNHELRIGNNTTINLEPDTLEETRRLYDALSEGSSDCAPLAEMFWGATWGTCLDRFGVRWMFNFAPAAG